MSLHDNADHGRESMLFTLQQALAMRVAASWQRVLVVAVVAAACSGIGLQLAWATPGVSIVTTIISGPVSLGAGKVKSTSALNEVEIETKGASDVYVVHNSLAPGGHTGWHSHPGPSIISVKAGQVTEYHPGSTNTPHIHAAGTCFLEPANQVHLLKNEGATTLELVAVQILPKGATRRIDAPAPQ
jgi:quercetin dioxygenase-like cupin family protein